MGRKPAKTVIKLAGRSLSLTKDSQVPLKKVRWFWIEQENVAVVFKEPTNIFVRLQGKIITVWLDHGVQPSKASYAYAVLPKISLAEAKRFERELPFRPVRHDENVHAVGELTGKSYGIVFFKPDSCLGIKSQSPALVYHKGDKDGGVFTIQDPLHKTKKIELAAGKLQGHVTHQDTDVSVFQNTGSPARIEISSVLGRIYRFGYGKTGQGVYPVPRKDLGLPLYEGIKVEAASDPAKTILTVHFPGNVVDEDYKLSVHFSKSQRLHDFSKADVLDRPSPNTVRYHWNRKPAEGPPVFSDYMKLTHGGFRVLLVTPLIETDGFFKVPEYGTK